MKTVIIAEKPDQGRKIAAIFPNAKNQKGFCEIGTCETFPDGAIITWAIGHLIELKAPEDYKEEWKNWNLEQLPIVPEKFGFKASKGKEIQLKIVSRFLKQADEIIIATDPAREGENIARLIIGYSGCSRKPIKRLWCKSLTPNALKNAFNELRDGDDTIPYFHEAQARQVSDWIIGLNLSRLYTILLRGRGIKEPFSVGRVQTPVLSMIYNRKNEIENFVSTPFFPISANVEKDGKMFKANFTASDCKVEDEAKNIVGKCSNSILVQQVEIERKKTTAPKYFSLSTLQTFANKKFKYSPAKVLEIVQGLYDKGFLSYPRTDSEYITENEAEYLQANISKYQELAKFSFQAESIISKSGIVNAKKVGDHYAIIVTEQIPTENDFSSFTIDEKNIYDCVLYRVLAGFMQDYEYEETKVTLDNVGYKFVCSGKVELNTGWKSLYSKKGISEESDGDEQQRLPTLIQGVMLKCSVGYTKRMTTVPKLYTEGQLITLMKTAGKYVEDSDLQKVLNKTKGLGTEATRSGIIEILKVRGFISIEKNTVTLTAKGIVLCKAVEGTILANPELTGKWELYLEKIGKGEKPKQPFIDNSVTLCRKLIDKVRLDYKSWEIGTEVSKHESDKYIATCPKCKKGKIGERKTFYGCSEYVNGCDFTLPKKFLGKTLSRTVVTKLCKGDVTSTIKGFTKKDGEKFDAALKLENGEIKLKFENAKKGVNKKWKKS